jgi:hypothetical protein
VCARRGSELGGTTLSSNNYDDALSAASRVMLSREVEVVRPASHDGSSVGVILMASAWYFWIKEEGTYPLY